MSVTMRTRGALDEDTVVSERVGEVIERHVSGLVGSPSPEIVQAICAEFTSPHERTQVLYYFLVESPLGVRDLKGVCGTMSLQSARLAATQAAIVRDRRMYTDKAPRWKQ